jgi:hypothetical protein
MADSSFPQVEQVTLPLYGPPIGMMVLIISADPQNRHLAPSGVGAFVGNRPDTIDLATALVNILNGSTLGANSLFCSSCFSNNDWFILFLY